MHGVACAQAALQRRVGLQGRCAGGGGAPAGKLLRPALQAACHPLVHTLHALDQVNRKACKACKPSVLQQVGRLLRIAACLIARAFDLV